MFENDVDKIIMFDTSIASDNIGDEIIMNSVYKEMSQILDKYMVLKHSTHTPVMHLFQLLSKSDPAFKYYTDAKYKFIGGSNIFKQTLRVRRADWNINAFDRRFYQGAITIGCGSSFGSSFLTDKYTEKIYKKMLNGDYYHSVRDDKTKLFLESLGLKAINTGCVTIWSLTEEHCNKIPRCKGENAVFTLTGYKPDIENDKKLVDIIRHNYEKVYFWPQSIGDMSYFRLLVGMENNIKILNPNLNAFESILDMGDVDYIGTRLHGGICALQHKCRSIIISIDNRAEDMNVKNNLRCIKRENIGAELNSRINENEITSINVDFDMIRKWKEQFL